MTQLVKFALVVVLAAVVIGGCASDDLQQCRDEKAALKAKIADLEKEVDNLQWLYEQSEKADETAMQEQVD